MAKRNLQRERERRKALARQQRMIAKAKRRRRNQLIAGLTVAALAVGGLATVVVTSVLSAREKNAAEQPAEDPGAESTPTPAPTSTAEPEPEPNSSLVPDPSLAEDREWTGALMTSVGDIEFTLDGAAAPQAVANFVSLAGAGYYDASSCHRLTTDGIYVLQCGSLTGDGTDDPGYQFGPIENSPDDGVYPAGTIAMANAGGEDTQGSQFFITYQESSIPVEIGRYSVFGHVTSGLELIEAVAAAGTVDGTSDGQPATTVTIDGIELL